MSRARLESLASAPEIGVHSPYTMVEEVVRAFLCDLVPDKKVCVCVCVYVCVCVCVCVRMRVRARAREYE